MAKQNQLVNLKRKLKKHADGIAKHRDALRDLECEISDILEPTNRAVEAIDDAINAIGEIL